MRLISSQVSQPDVADPDFVRARGGTDEEEGISQPVGDDAAGVDVGTAGSGLSGRAAPVPGRPGGSAIER